MGNRARRQNFLALPNKHNCDPGMQTVLAVIWFGVVTAVTKKVSTVENLGKKGIMSNNISDMCSSCTRERDLNNQLFLHIVFSVAIWNHFFSVAWFGVFQNPLLRWRMSTPKMVDVWRFNPFHGCGILLWRMVLYAILWSMWTERKDFQRIVVALEAILS